VPVSAARPPVLAPPAPKPAFHLAAAPHASTNSQLPAAPAAPSANDIELPLASVIASLAPELRARLTAAATANLAIRLPAGKVVSQLAFGAVKIPFGELRRLAPGVFANSAGELDNKLVNLPLQEILTRMSPALLSRRPAKKLEVSAEIAGPFAERGRGFTFTTQPLKGAAAPAPAAPPPPEPPCALVPPMGIRQTSPTPMAPPNIPQRSITPAPPAGSSLADESGPSLSSLSPRTLSQTPPNSIGTNGHGGNGNGHALPPVPGLRIGSLDGNGHSEAPTPLRMPPLPGAPTPLPASAESEAIFSVMLPHLCEKWPDAVKDEISKLAPGRAGITLKGSMIVPGLKRGRIVMSWQQIRLLADPGSAPSPNDSLELELPLKIIAPLFMAAQKNPRNHRASMLVSAEIPDLFFGFPRPAAPPAPPSAPAAEAPPAAAVPLVPLLPKAPSPVALDTNFYTLADKTGVAGPEGTAPAPAPGRGATAVQTDFLNRQAHPKEVVARAVALPGVAGAIVAMQDGLRVASQVPAGLNDETLAAFLPQIFERVNQCTRELRMGALNNVNFTVGNVPWKIFRVNAVYFAAFGRACESLPSPQLAQLAAELDRKKTQ
jgi:predicted regulator of Ras-like GTPase activity (Roadblock/LC7/MglB family)